MKYRMSIVAGCVLLVCCFLLNGCYYDKSLPTAADEFQGDVSFANDILPIFASDCLSSGCHDGTVKPNLMSANAYIALKADGYIDANQPTDSKLYKWMQGEMSTPMPPAGPDLKNNALILAWIKQGSLNN
jgi:hypothetical protein